MTVSYTHLDVYKRQPLAGEEESRMIGRLGSRMDQEAKETLIEHNLRLVVYKMCIRDSRRTGRSGFQCYIAGGSLFLGGGDRNQKRDRTDYLCGDRSIDGIPLI